MNEYGENFGPKINLVYVFIGMCGQRLYEKKANFECSFVRKHKKIPYTTHATVSCLISFLCSGSWILIE